jgi:hypothetical protein
VITFYQKKKLQIAVIRDWGGGGGRGGGRRMGPGSSFQRFFIPSHLATTWCSKDLPVTSTPEGLNLAYFFKHIVFQPTRIHSPRPLGETVEVRKYSTADSQYDFYILYQHIESTVYL